MSLGCMRPGFKNRKKEKKKELKEAKGATRKHRWTHWNQKNNIWHEQNEKFNKKIEIMCTHKTKQNRSSRGDECNK